MAQHRSLAVGKDRRKPMPTLVDARVADGIDASVEGVKTPGPQPPADRAPPKPQGHQLLSRHDAVLALCELRQRAPLLNRPLFAVANRGVWVFVHDYRAQAQGPPRFTPRLRLTGALLRAAGRVPGPGAGEEGALLGSAA